MEVAEVGAPLVEGYIGCCLALQLDSIGVPHHIWF